MKLLNRQQFLAQPSGVVFCEEDANLEDWKIKGDTVTDDIFNWQPFVTIASETFTSSQLAVCSLRSVGTAGSDFYDWQRNNFQDTEQSYVVLEKHEVRGLIERLEQTILEGYADIIS